MKKDHKQEMLDEAKKRFEACENYYAEDYSRGAEDADFALGKQWPDRIKATRSKENRPCLVENRMLPFVNQVVNSIRQAKPSVVVRPVDSGADVDTAEIMRGIIRNIESTSNAETCYDTAARNSVMSGIGWLRIGTRYCDYNSFDQEVYIDRIQNFQSVLLDINSQKLDGSDAEYGFIYTDIEKEKFERDYPDEDLSVLKGSGWYDGENVRISEYFYKDYTKKTLIDYEYQGVTQTYRDTAYKEDLTEEFLDSITILKSRDTHECSVKYAKFSGDICLEEGEFPGKYIPIIPVYGFETFVDGKRRFFSLIHQAKDPQMMLNYWKTAATEVVALQPKTPYIGAKGQFKTYGKQWASANVQNFPFLEYDLVVDPVTGQLAPPPLRQPPPTSSGSMMQEATLSAEAIKASLGMFDAAIGNQTNDVSGKAIISRQLQGDNATFHFVDNLSAAISHCGRIMVGIIPLVYSGKRIVRILGEDGKEALVPLLQNVVKSGEEYQAVEGPGDLKFDLDAGKYDVVVEVGNSYATRRKEASNTLLELSRHYPSLNQVAGDLLLKSLDMPYGEDIAKRIRASMPPELLGDDVEAARLQQMDAALKQLQEKLQLTEQALLAKGKNEEFQNSLDLKKVENDTAKIQIEAAKAQAEIEKMRAETNGISSEILQDLANAVTDLNDRSADVEQAMDVILSLKEEEATGVPETPEKDKV